eukprot:999247_1
MAMGQENKISGVRGVPRTRNCSSVSKAIFIDDRDRSSNISYSTPTYCRSRSKRGPYNGSELVASMTSRPKRVIGGTPTPTDEDVDVEANNPSTISIGFPVNGSMGMDF